MFTGKCHLSIRKKRHDANKQDLEYRMVWFSEETGLKLSLTSTLDMQ